MTMKIQQKQSSMKKGKRQKFRQLGKDEKEKITQNIKQKNQKDVKTERRNWKKIGTKGNTEGN